jgi:predicted HicB family RNase H-like nuclease
MATKNTKKSQKSQTQDSAPTDETGPTKGKSHGDRKILSIAIDPSLHAKLALLARAEGRSVTDLVVDAVSKNLKSRITSALDSLRADLEK